MSPGDPPSTSVRSVSLEEVLNAEKRRKEATSRLERIEGERKRIQSRLNALERRIRRANRTRSWVIPLRQFLQDSTTVIGGYVCLVISVFALCLVLGHLGGLSWRACGLLTVLFTMIVAAIGWNLVRFDEAANARLIESLNQQASDQKDHFTRAVSDFERASRAFQAAKLFHDDLRRKYEGPINQLRLMNWRTMKGVQLEEFLASIFRAYGIPVETTPGSGDHGVDLVLTIRGCRIAVQVKGYEKKVDNKAVQQAYAGMNIYSCGDSAVITNSSFTPGAVTLARSNRCYLIDGDGIPALIEGRFSALFGGSTL